MPPRRLIGRCRAVGRMEPIGVPAVNDAILAPRSEPMTFGKGILLWLIGIPLPIILLLALFWHH